MVRLKKIWNAVRHGLFVQRVRERLLSDSGILVQPYYWTLEGSTDGHAQKLGRGLEDYSFQPFGEEEVKELASLIPGREEADMLAKLHEGKLCFGLKYQGRPAAATWCNLTESHFRWYNIRLGDREAYLFDMFTMEAFRGANIAPYLRYRTYEALREMGRDTFYSVTERFNAPSVRFKQKLGAKFLWLGVGIDLFGKFQRHFILRRYRV
jgi:GNAT superfamily N-acetyltransferase